MFLNISPNKEKCISSEERKVQEEQGKALWRWAARSSNRRVWWRTVKSPFQPLDKKYILYLPISYVFTGAAGRISYKEEKRKCHSALHPSCLIPSLSHHLFPAPTQKWLIRASVQPSGSAIRNFGRCYTLSITRGTQVFIMYMAAAHNAAL